MSKHTPAAWTPDELRQMQEDWWRTGHNLTQVAELHACDRADVIMALGLTVADIKRSKKARRDLPRWETVNPEKAAEFVRLLEGGSTMTAACAAVGIKNRNTGYVIYKRIKERNALMSNEEKMVTAVAQAIQPPAADQPEPVRPEDYTVQDLCERYGVSDDTITRWMRAGEFGETVNPTPRLHLVTLSGITAFDERHTGPAYAGQPAAPTRRRISRADPGRI